MRTRKYGCFCGMPAHFLSAFYPLVRIKSLHYKFCILPLQKSTVQSDSAVHKSTFSCILRELVASILLILLIYAVLLKNLSCVVSTNRLQRLKSPPELHGSMYGEYRRDDPLSLAGRSRNDSDQYVYRCPEHQAMCARYSHVCDNVTNINNIGHSMRYHSDNSSDQLSPL